MATAVLGVCSEASALGGRCTAEEDPPVAAVAGSASAMRTVFIALACHPAPVAATAGTLHRPGMSGDCLKRSAWPAAGLCGERRTRPRAPSAGCRRSTRRAGGC